MTDVPIYIVKTPTGLIANNVGPGILINPQPSCSCMRCLIKRYHITARDEALSRLGKG